MGMMIRSDVIINSIRIILFQCNQGSQNDFQAPTAFPGKHDGDNSICNAGHVVWMDVD